MKNHSRKIFGAVLMIGFLSILWANCAFAGQSFISASGTSLMLDGKSFIPKGINLMDHDTLWYTLKSSPTLNWTKDSDFRSIKLLGFNSVRLAVKSDYFQDPKPPHAFSTKGFVWLDKVIAAAKKNNLRLILDMHMPIGGQQQDYQINSGTELFWGDPWMKGRFVDIWREIARRYANEPTIWAYDLMNEPATTDFVSYEKLMQKTTEAIRSFDDKHLIMLQRGMYIKEDGTWDMKYPDVVDSKTIRTIHFYQPTDFTLQGAPWIKTKARLVSYPAVSSTMAGLNTESLNHVLSGLAADLRSTSTPVVLTEFGTLFPKRLSGQPLWVRDVAKIAQNFDLGWHYWHYSGPSCTNAFALKTKNYICRPKTQQMLSELAHF